jgi:DNA polymerase-1
MIPVIDGDVLCFQGSVVGEQEGGTLDWGEAESGQASFALTRQVIDEKVKTWCKWAGGSTDNVKIVFSDPDGDNFRMDFCPHYKQNREGTSKPSTYKDARAYIEDRYGATYVPRLEGDDVLSLMATGPNGNKYVIISTDKDIYTIPGTVMRVRHMLPRSPGLVKVSLKDADLYWMTQTITGDSIDNYKGAPGAGPKRAEEALSHCRDLRAMWDKVLEVYADQFDNKRWGKKFVTDNAYDEALMNARCARLLRYGDYDKETQEIKLWTP